MERHQRLMGIDFGSVRVGIASTDESGEFALPRAVIPNSDSLLDEVVKLAREWQIQRIVVGESKHLDGTHNPIHSLAREFVDRLREAGLETEFHPEVYTSIEASRLQGENAMLDASAAALILKSYIDTHNHA